MAHPESARVRSTTILAVRREGQVAMGGDGQVTLKETIVKHEARKIRRLTDGKILVGFAGSTGDSFALLERFEAKLKEFPGNLLKAATELAKDWRTDRALRRLESLLAVAGPSHLLLLSGAGDVIEPDDGVIGIGSGGPYAVAAARALLHHTTLAAKEIAEEALRIASEICVYTNSRIAVEVL